MKPFVEASELSRDHRQPHEYPPQSVAVGPDTVDFFRVAAWAVAGGAGLLPRPHRCTWRPDLARCNAARRPPARLGFGNVGTPAFPFACSRAVMCAISWVISC